MVTQSLMDTLLKRCATFRKCLDAFIRGAERIHEDDVEALRLLYGCAHQVPDDPREKVFGENSTVTVIGQEFGHRWFASLGFRDHTSRPSRALLGRDSAHWSFFFDSDGSVLEGNDIVDCGNGKFRTAAAVERYSLLDQYAMGLVHQTQVPPFYYVENPTNVVPQRTATSAPQVGVSFDGTRREVRMEDVITVMGPRVPSAADSPRVYRQAFVYVTVGWPNGGTRGDPESRSDSRGVGPVLSAATDSRMQVDTRMGFTD